MCDLLTDPYIAELRAARLANLSPASAAAPLSGVAPPGPSGAGDPLSETHA